MKRSLYKRLHRTQHPHLGRADTAQVATAVMVVPDAAVPAGHPARDWMEMATARMWAKPTADGLLVAVRTYGRDADGYTANDEVLATGLVLDLYGSLADKRHRIYHHAETGTLCTELIEPATTQPRGTGPTGWSSRRDSSRRLSRRGRGGLPAPEADPRSSS